MAITYLTSQPTVNADDSSVLLVNSGINLVIYRLKAATFSTLRFSSLTGFEIDRFQQQVFLHKIISWVDGERSGATFPVLGQTIADDK